MTFLSMPFAALVALAPHRVIERPAPPPAVHAPAIHHHHAKPPTAEPRPCKCIRMPPPDDLFGPRDR